jgi:cell division control protein 6
VANSGDSVIYNLTRINSELRRARVSIVGISNDLKFTSFLDARVQSSLSGEEIVFSPYDAGQLEDILEQRAGLAFKPGVLDEFVVGLCAALAAREHGDARRALDLLRVSGEIAERECSERVVEGHVRRAREKIETDHVVEAVRTLPTQSKLVLYAVVLLDEGGLGRITTGDVYSLYGRLCRVVGLDVLTSRRVSDLVLELDLLGILDTVVVSKGRYGRSREIVLDVPAVGIRLVLEDDVRLRSLIDYKAPQRTLK